MIQHSVGENAGKIWRLLDEKGELSFAQIKKELKAKNEELYMAIGWLLRENQINCKEEDDKVLYSVN
jgi:3-methyladenine DNA glycosylase AlkD